MWQLCSLQTLSVRPPRLQCVSGDGLAAVTISLFSQCAVGRRNTGTFSLCSQKTVVKPSEVPNQALNSSSLVSHDEWNERPVGTAWLGPRPLGPLASQAGASLRERRPMKPHPSCDGGERRRRRKDRKRKQNRHVDGRREQSRRKEREGDGGVEELRVRHTHTGEGRHHTTPGSNQQTERRKSQRLQELTETTTTEPLGGAWILKLRWRGNTITITAQVEFQEMFVGARKTSAPGQTCREVNIPEKHWAAGGVCSAAQRQSRSLWTSGGATERHIFTASSHSPEVNVSSLCFVLTRLQLRLLPQLQPTPHKQVENEALMEEAAAAPASRGSGDITRA
ncbi:unnamed protein product [Pleuronectes platessa]|uniref:Uncharacterized protein n=1 Tax=Pleuronectes platessa TaxID=8262 RepID=A0A9N7YI15_PLEPL|nr:unnamed protein product [Pleuronectes platessa]